MRRWLIIISLCLVAASAVVAQPRMSLSSKVMQVGQVQWKQPTRVTFHITNTGNTPLVLTDVEPDCACTVADWTKTPIAPGEKGEVNITYDAKLLGRFRKSVAVLSNATPSLVYLDFEGQVVGKVTDFTKTHPHRIDDILLDTLELDFPDAQQGEHPVLRMSVVNLGKTAYEPVLMHLPTYVEMKTYPPVLRTGQRGDIELTLLSDKLPDYGLTQTSVYLSRYMGDKVSEENEIPMSAVLVPDFSHLTETELRNAPAVKLSTTMVDMTQLLQKKPVAKQTVVITNTGKSDLKISKLQVFNPAVGARLGKAVVKPGKSTKLQVKLSKADVDKNRRHLRLLMITNDPQQAKVIINIKAK